MGATVRSKESAGVRGNLALLSLFMRMISPPLVALMTVLVAGCHRDETPRKVSFADADAAERAIGIGTGGGQCAQGKDHEQKWCAEVTAELESLANKCVHVGERFDDTEKCLILAGRAPIVEGQGIGHIERTVGNQVGLLGVAFDEKTMIVKSYDVYVRKWEGHWQN